MPLASSFLAHSILLSVICRFASALAAKLAVEVLILRQAARVTDQHAS
jgi:hypothetical protein